MTYVSTRPDIDDEPPVRLTDIFRVVKSAPLVLALWLICLSAIIIVWGLMPTFLSQVALIVLFILIFISTLLRQSELPVLSTIFLCFLVISYWQAKNPNLQIYATIAIAAIVPIIGLIGEKVNRSFKLISENQLFSHWLLLGLISAEMSTVFNNWPVSFFNRSLMASIVFYAFWQLFRIQHNNERRSLAAHFIFVGITVILVVGIIIWANFPHLTNF